jgi:SAM-dependent methyltransferase
MTPRGFSEQLFNDVFEQVVMAGTWQEQTQYYPRYRTRYEAVLRRYAELVPSHPIDVLEIGGGQLAALATRLWGDRGAVGDLGDTCFPTLKENGVETFHYNLARDEPPPGKVFDAVLFSEVIEHLPVPGHVALHRLLKMLRPGGLIVCSTPNLYRLRNVVYLAAGRPIFDHFDTPGDRGSGHVLEYSAEHLRWQFERSGFLDVEVELREFAHRPHRRLDRLLSVAGKPLLCVARFRDNLMATGVAPEHRAERAVDHPL